MNESKETWSVKILNPVICPACDGQDEINEAAGDQAEALLNAARAAGKTSIDAADAVAMLARDIMQPHASSKRFDAAGVYADSVKSALETLHLRFNDSCRELADDLDGNPHVDQETAYAQSKPAEQMLEAVADDLEERLEIVRTVFQRSVNDLVVQLAAGTLDFPAAQGGSFPTPSVQWQQKIRKETLAMCNDVARAATEYENCIMGIATMVIQGIIPTTAPAKPTTQEALAAHAERLTTACREWHIDLRRAKSDLNEAGVEIPPITGYSEIFG